MGYRKMSDKQLALEFRNMRNNARPLFCELVRRGFVVSEKHGHHIVPMSTFENIIIKKQPKVERL